MLTLIAESKTMRDGQTDISPAMLKGHIPAGEQNASRIMERLENLSQPELMAETGLSSSLAVKLRQMLVDFPNKMLGQKAIEAFTGVVFKALKYESLNGESRLLCEKDVRIISSLYGLLCPDDIIKPYRLDFTSKAAPGGITLNSFWKKDVTIQLVRTVIDNEHKEILNLLPADAAKCIDWKIIKRFCKVWKADFVEITDGGKTRTPAANKLKTMRGDLLHRILSDGITDISGLKDITSDNFIFEGTPVYPDHLQFIC